MWAELLFADRWMAGRADRHDEANGHFCERAYKPCERNVNNVKCSVFL